MLRSPRVGCQLVNGVVDAKRTWSVYIAFGALFLVAGAVHPLSTDGRSFSTSALVSRDGGFPA
jgi:hypothetical protein